LYCVTSNMDFVKWYGKSMFWALGK